MRKWLSLFTLLAIPVIVGSGCASYHMGCQQGHPYRVCDPTHCADGCGTCGPVATEPCQDACSYGNCGGCGECDICDPCSPCYYGEYSPFGILAPVFRLFRPVAWMGPSCGERYWGDYISSPPDCCDPCDCHGNFTGVHVDDCPRRCGHKVRGACVESACEAGCVDCGSEPGCTACTGGEMGFPTRAMRTVEPRYLGQRPLQMPVQRQAAYRSYRAGVVVR